MVRRLQNVQALRASAALLVVLDHLPRLEMKALGQPGILAGFGVFGSAGVDLFFVVSGFIMTVTTWASFAEVGSPGRFLLRRAARIYPMYWIGAAAFALMLALSGKPELFEPLRLLSTLTLLPTGHEISYTIAWSLQFEMFFYVVFAIALRFPKSLLPLVLGVWTASIFALNAIAGGNPLLQFFGNPLALEFIGGIGIGILAVSGRLTASRLILPLGVVALLAACISNMIYGGLGAEVLGSWHRTLTAGAASVLLVYGAVSAEHRGILAPRQLVKLGDASYSMYLMHGLIVGAVAVAFAHLHRHGLIADIAYVAITYAAAIIGSVVIYHFVEQRIVSALRNVGRPGRRQVEETRSLETALSP